MSARRVFTVILLTLLTSTAMAECARVAGLEADALISYLKSVTAGTDPECISQAVTKLGALRAVRGVDALVDFLDFQRPQSEREKYHVADMHDKYPAVSAIMSVGLPAVPPLVAKLGGGQMSQIARYNGLRTLGFIYRDNPTEAIRALKLAAAKAEKPDEAYRLNSCAKDLVPFCADSWRGRCESALNEK